MMRAIVTGATSQIAEFLLPQLVEAGYSVLAISRKPRPQGLNDGVSWMNADIASDGALGGVEHTVKVAIHLAPLVLLPGILEPMSRMSASRIIAFSSTSVFTKASSGNSGERTYAENLRRAEEKLERFSKSRGIYPTVFRPTLIYGGEGDNGVRFIENHIRRFGFFPIVGAGLGLRQPVHAEDLARACLLAVDCKKTFNRSYNLSGAEVMSYRQMVEQIFDHMGRKPRTLSIPLPLFRLAMSILKVLPRYRALTSEMAARMNEHLNFDHCEAARDFGYSPRGLFGPPSNSWPALRATSGLAISPGLDDES